MLLGAAESVFSLKTSAPHLTKTEKRAFGVNHEHAWIKFETSKCN
jgi:hypothetical protein